MANQLRQSGKHVESGPMASLDVLKARANAGRDVWVAMEDQQGQSRWTKVLGSTSPAGDGLDWLELEDPDTGESIPCPPELLMHRSGALSQTLVVDPHRDAEGRSRAQDPPPTPLNTGGTFAWCVASAKM